MNASALTLSVDQRRCASTREEMWTVLIYHVLKTTPGIHSPSKSNTSLRVIKWSMKLCNDSTSQRMQGNLL